MPKDKPGSVRRPLRRGDKGQDVKILQGQINQAYRHFKIDRQIAVDGEVGKQTLNAAEQIATAMGALRNNRKALKAGRIPESAQRLIRRRDKYPKEIRATKRRKRYRQKLRKRYASTLQERAYKVALSLVGVMEQGGNNMGPKVSEIIRANGGVGPEPWCGDFVAFCYRLAGSKAVARGWAVVAWLAGLAGLKVVGTPKRGDLVTFNFDHVGMFDKDNGDGTITTIEGNTGASGAVSDSSTGGDGVYRKVRSKSLVSRYIRVTR